jgi:type II secretory pathway component PulL
MKGPQNVDLDNILSGLKTKSFEPQPSISRNYNGDAGEDIQQIDFNQDNNRMTLNFNADNFMSRDNQDDAGTTTNINMNDDSLISISSLKSIQHGATMPKKSRRRNRSDKNTISLDI